MTIHSTDPFETPGGERSPVRRFRGRLPSAVTLWTAAHGGRPAGLTVSSTVVVDGDPGRLLGVLDEESELYEALLGSGRFVVMALRESDSRLADTFAGLMPAPGGPFVGHPWQDTAFGPVLAGAAYAFCTLDHDRAFGWGRLIEATLDSVDLPEAGGAPLVRHRGRYVRLG